MENNDEFKRAVDSIKKTLVTVDEMARKMGIPLERFHVYLEGAAKPPIDLANRLLAAYGIRTSMGWSTKSTKVPVFIEPQNEAEERERDRTSLKAIISLIKDRGVRTGQPLTEEDMAAKVGISAEQMQAYLNNEAKIPDDFTHTLLTVYQPLLDAVRREDNRHNLMTMLVKIRNLGLVEGMDITLEEMIYKLEITGEQLYAYLAGEYDLGDDLYFVLQTAYKDLVKASGQVRVKEHIYLDEGERKVRFVT